MSKHTPGPWRQGITLGTPETRRWTTEQIEQNNERERCLVFARFTPLDAGRSRELVAHVFTSEEDARLIAAAPDLLEALKECADLVEHCIIGCDAETAASKARAAIAKGEQA